MGKSAKEVNNKENFSLSIMLKGEIAVLPVSMP